MHTNVSDQTPLYISCVKGHTDVVRVLLEQGNADVNSVSQRSTVGLTPLYIASFQGHTEIVKLLIKRSADVNKRILLFGATPLYASVTLGHTEVVKELLKARANPTAVLPNGLSPLHAAALRGIVEIVQALVELGHADVNIRTDDGATPLILACRATRISVIKYLIQKGANVTLATTDGRTPLSVIVSQHDDLTRCVKEHEMIEVHDDEWSNYAPAIECYICSCCGKVGGGFPMRYCVTCMFIICPSCLPLWRTISKENQECILTLLQN